MANMRLTKNEMPVQAPDIRNKNFSEVALGYTREQAIDEAKRCLNCKHKPCVSGCPVGIDIPAFLDFDEFIEQELDITFSTEVVNDDIKLGLWINGIPCTEEYIFIEGQA